MPNRSAHFHIQEDDVVASTAHITRRRLKLPLLPGLIFATLVAILAIFLSMRGGMSDLLGILAWAVLALVGLMAVLHYWVLPRQSRRQFQQLAALAEEVQMIWDEQEVTFTRTRATATFAWNEFYRWSENDDLLLLAQSEAYYNIVPKRALDPEQSADIRRCIEQAGLKKM